MGGVKMTLLKARILRAFLDDPAAARYGADLCADLDAHSGSVFPALWRLEAEGWLTAETEQVDLRVVQRPARVYYRLTETGRQDAQRELTDLADQLRPLLDQLQPPAAGGPA